MGVPTEEIWQRVAKSLESVDMTAYRYHSPNKLSGGQKQRIAISRAIMTDPEILILDDSLSAVDAKTEEAILMNLKTLRANQTTIITANRLSSVMHADEIIVMDDGTIAERGTHDSLLAQQGWYAEMWVKQQLNQAMGGQ